MTSKLRISVVVGGEQGAGKSTLLRDLTDFLQEKGFTGGVTQYGRGLGPLCEYLHMERESEVASAALSPEPSK